MKLLTAILCTCLALPAFAQEPPDFTYIPQKVGANPNSSAGLLSKELTSPYKTDVEKVRSIFRWITDNIEYRTRHSRIMQRRNKSSYKEPEDTGELQPLDERVAETVLENRLAVCDGYARLFKTLCDYAGVESVVISGYARTEAGKRIQRFSSNHSWNAVRIDSSWKLLDVTWASGYITWQGDNFVRYYDEQYFLTSPDQFIHEHYPDDLHWTLMTDPPLMSEFRYSPFKQRSFTKYRITSYSPSQGVLDIAPGDTVNIELETANAAADRQISADPFLDTALYNTDISVLLTPTEFARNKMHYTYVANSPAIQWIYILYNRDLILRYRLRVLIQN